MGTHVEPVSGASCPRARTCVRFVHKMALFCSCEHKYAPDSDVYMQVTPETVWTTVNSISQELRKKRGSGCSGGADCEGHS